MKRFYSWLFWPKEDIALFLKPTGIVTILVSIFPVFGVLYFYWEPLPILLLYCAEMTINIFFDCFKPTNTEINRSLPRSLRVFNYLIILVMLLILQTTVITIVIYTTEDTNAWESVQSIYFGISAGIIIVSHIISKVEELIKLKINKQQKNRTTKYSPENLFMIRQLLQIAIAFVVALTGSYRILLICIVVLKAFLDIRFYMRKTKLPETIKNI
jgi:hypothetical protein